MSVVSFCEPLVQNAYTRKVSEEESVPVVSKKKVKVKRKKAVRPPSHPFVHLLLLLVCCICSAQGFFPVPGNKIGFLAIVLFLGYLYPMLLKWLRPRTGFWMGLFYLQALLLVAESVGVAGYEARTAGFFFPNGFLDDVLLAPVVLISVGGVVLSGLTTYLLGWNMLRIWMQVFGKLQPAYVPVKRKPAPKPQPVQVNEEPVSVPDGPR